MSAAMNALAIRPEAVVPAPSATPASAPDGRFADLLGAMGRPSSSAGSAAQADRKAPEDADASDAAAPSALQSLEATLNGLLRAAPNPPPPPSASSAAPAAAPLDAALSAAAGALDGGLFDVSGQTPLKTLLQADPSLGLKTFQIKTYLAAAGATPARAGGTALGVDADWSPLGAPNARPAPAAGAARAAVASRGASPPPSHAAASAPPGAAPVGTIAASPRRRDGDAPAAAPQAPAALSPDAASAPTLSVPLADLPAFIADAANALTSAAAEPPVASPATATTPKAAQAVKELQIALDPGELGEMTLKLRLAGGKLSVTIAVANPRTLSAIEDDRALIAARLGDAGQALGDLVIQRQAAASSLTETISAHALPQDNGAPTTGGERHSAKSPQERPDPPPRGGAGAGGDPGDFLV